MIWSINGNDRSKKKKQAQNKLLFTHISSLCLGEISNNLRSSVVSFGARRREPVIQSSKDSRDPFNSENLQSTRLISSHLSQPFHNEEKLKSARESSLIRVVHFRALWKKFDYFAEISSNATWSLFSSSSTFSVLSFHLTFHIFIIANKPERRGSAKNSQLSIFMIDINNKKNWRWKRRSGKVQHKVFNVPSPPTSSTLNTLCFRTGKKHSSAPFRAIWEHSSVRHTLKLEVWADISRLAPLFSDRAKSFFL